MSGKIARGTLWWAIYVVLWVLGWMGSMVGDMLDLYKVEDGDVVVLLLRGDEDGEAG